MPRPFHVQLYYPRTKQASDIVCVLATNTHSLRQC